MKILYITTIDVTMGFFKNLIKHLIEDGHTVDLACHKTGAAVLDYYKDLGCKIFPLSCSRSPLSKGNITAVKEIKALVHDGGYDIVHCHTPIAAACTRLACKKFRKQGLRVFYTAHGFHFYKGAPKKNWMIFYPIEKLCARYTDALITINHEDYERSCRKFKTKSIYVPGVGVDTERFKTATCERIEKRRELGIPEDAFLLVSIGELNQNKNHRTVIDAMAKLENQNIYYIIAGIGAEQEALLAKAKELGLEDRVKLLGYRNDIAELCHAADTFVFPSLREGLPVSMIEAMSCSLPCIASLIRGCEDLIDEQGGFLVSPQDAATFAEKISTLESSKSMRNAFGQHNREKTNAFNVDAINKKMYEIYGLEERVTTLAK